jgi:hypothetical protein
MLSPRRYQALPIPLPGLLSAVEILYSPWTTNQMSRSNGGQHRYVQTREIVLSLFQSEGIRSPLGASSLPRSVILSPTSNPSCVGTWGRVDWWFSCSCQRCIVILFRIFSLPPPPFCCSVEVHNYGVLGRRWIRTIFQMIFQTHPRRCHKQLVVPRKP